MTLQQSIKENGRYAYIFDFDGVLADSMEIILQCYNDIFRRYGFAMDKDFFLVMAGRPPVDLVSAMCAKHDCMEKQKLILKEYYDLYASRLLETPPVHNNVCLLNLLKKSGNPVAIASGSPKREVALLSGRLGIYADAIVSSDEVPLGKPNPDVFLKAAQLLGIEPEKCIVVEDSENGVQAAKAAGMHVMKYINRKSL